MSFYTHSQVGCTHRGFDRVYEEIDHLEDKVDHLQSDFEGFRDEINQKLDTILRHLTGIN